jgi:UDP-2-acetamido-3-amino-2,3-dideoxy-glucuronate N-acetyltransferase
VSWLHPFKEQRFVVVGERQMAVFDDTAPWSEKLMLFPHHVDWLEGRVPVARRAEGVAVALEPDEPLLAECRHFAEVVRDRRPPLTDGNSGLRVLQVLEAAQRSLGAGGERVVLAAGPAHSSAGAFVHPSAVVDDGASIGAGSRVWHFTHVMSGARVGESCTLGQNVFVAKGARIGNDVKVQNNVSVYEGVEIEDHVFCGPSVVFTNVVNPRAEVERKDDYRATLIRRGASLGANATIVCGIEVGPYALVGAGAVVTKNVPSHAIVAGVPARVIGWACRCGERLGLVGEGATCVVCGLTYLRSGGELRQDES